MSEWHTGWTEGYASARSEAQAEIGNLQAKCETIYDELLEARAENENLRHLLDAETEQARKDVVYFDELRAENEKLRAALKPFAHEAQFISSHAEDTWFYYDGIRFGDLRAAAAALKETDNG